MGTEIDFFGAVGGVTGSCTLYDKSLLVDCGLYQGIDEKEGINYKPFDFDVNEIELAVITHAHLDHSGLIARLVKAGYRGDFLMTPQTKELTALVLSDMIHVVASNGNEPLYNYRELNETLNQCVCVPYNTPVKIGNKIVSLVNSGHIAGSASVAVEKYGRKHHTTIFSGDLGNGSYGNTVFADTIIMESTYGDKMHVKEDPYDVLYQEAHQLEVQNEGTLLIPTFSIDRAQMILGILRNLKLLGLISDDLPVYLDTPMGIEATKIYNRYFNQPKGKRTELSYEELFKFKGLKLTSSRQASEAIPRNNKPKIVMAGAGMMQGGRILRHAGYYLPDEKSRILFVGYQSEGTISQQIASGEKLVFIDGQWVPVNAHVRSSGTFSAHADQNTLVDWLHGFSGISNIILNHGGDKQRCELAKRLENEYDGVDIFIPKHRQALTV
ncbi:MAG: MBL fold metallo-hydrolase [Candidatus Daviesbacteria bacterium]|nr:MBL fold metallo-hydrolase [Candidatus Daviesbacteria bacterium]